MPNTPASQIDNIHAMLDSGHHSVRIEKHTFLIWGLTGAALIMFLEWFGNQNFFEVYWQNIIAIYSIGAVVLVLAGFTDHAMTKKVRAQRAESISFAQGQLMKLWWLVAALCILIGLGLSSMRLAVLLYPIILSILGMVLFTQGLFSRQALSFAGFLLIIAAAIGLGLAVSKTIPYSGLLFLAISVLGIGLPLFSWLVTEPKKRATGQKIGLALGWLAAVFLPVFIASHLWKQVTPPTGQPVALNKFLSGKEDYKKGQYIVLIPSGTAVPLAIKLEGKSLTLDNKKTTIATHLTADMQVGFKDGKPDGRVKVADGAWENWNNKGWPLWLKNVKTDLTSEKGPNAILKLFANF